VLYSKLFRTSLLTAILAVSLSSERFALCQEAFLRAEPRRTDTYNRERHRIDEWAHRDDEWEHRNNDWRSTVNLPRLAYPNAPNRTVRASEAFSASEALKSRKQLITNGGDLTGLVKQHSIAGNTVSEALSPKKPLFPSQYLFESAYLDLRKHYQWDKDVYQSELSALPNLHANLAPPPGNNASPVSATTIAPQLINLSDFKRPDGTLDLTAVTATSNLSSSPLIVVDDGSDSNPTKSVVDLQQQTSRDVFLARDAGAGTEHLKVFQRSVVRSPADIAVFMDPGIDDYELRKNLTSPFVKNGFTVYSDETIVNATQSSNVLLIAGRNNDNLTSQLAMLKRAGALTGKVVMLVSCYGEGVEVRNSDLTKEPDAAAAVLYFSEELNGPWAENILLEFAKGPFDPNGLRIDHLLRNAAQRVLDADPENREQENSSEIGKFMHPVVQLSFNDALGWTTDRIA